MKIETQVGLFILAAIGIFFYLSVNIGSWRFDGSAYTTYKVYFDNTGNLEKKSNVKIAGVPIGRVIQRNLMDNGLAEVIIEIHKSHKLFRNCYAKITQDGLIGGYTLEIDPGDSSSGILPPGSNLPMPGKASASVQDVVESVKDITDSVQDVVSSFSNVFATPEGEKMIASTLQHVLNASKKLTEFSVRLDDLMKENREPIDDVCKNVKAASDNLNSIIKTLEEKSSKVTENVVTFSDDLKASGNSLKSTLENTDSITGKISKGEGSLGKLVNDKVLYDDVKDAVKGVKKMVDKVGQLSVTVDMHWASLIGKKSRDLPTEEECFPLSFNMFEVRLATQPDYYYSASISTDRNGPIKRTYSWIERYDQQGNLINTDDPSFSKYQQARVENSQAHVSQSPNGMFFGFQFCKKFNDLTLRIGLTEGTFGVGLDYDFSLRFDQVRWLASLDAFDFVGSNRLNDRRPHVRLSNKVYFMKRMYTYFGVDDIFSKRDAACFWGAGLSFDDDDLKYLLSYLPVGKMA